MSGGWRDAAACRGLPVDTMVFDTRDAPAAVAAAIAVCHRCPVHLECLDAELAHIRRNGDRYASIGVRGGTDQLDRHLTITAMPCRRAETYTESMALRAEVWAETEMSA